MIQTVIGINSAAMRTTGKKKKQVEEYRKELQEIISQVNAAKNRLASLSVDLDGDDMETESVDEALDALDDAIDILQDALEEEE